MHSQIVAISFLMPCFGFEWDNKVKSLFEKMNLDCFCFRPNEINKCLKTIKNGKIDLVSLKENVEKASAHSKQMLIDEIFFTLKKY